MSDTQKHKQQEQQQEQEQQEEQYQNPTTTTTSPNMHHQDTTDPFLAAAAARSTIMFPPHQEPLPWQLPFNHHDPFLFPPPLPSSSLFGRRHLQFSSYEAGPSSSFGGAPFGLQMQAELNRMTAQEIMDAKALAASKSHSEAERRRRERINNHLAKLRSLLPSTTKTDKASLLAEVIQHVKELKRQTSAISESDTVPTESDELTVDPAAEFDYEGRPVVRASLCCDDRPDLMPDLIKALKGLRLRTLKAEITTLGGRVKNVLFITGDDETSPGDGDDEISQPWSVSDIQEALRAVMEKSGGGGRDDSASGNAKRQRTNTN